MSNRPRKVSRKQHPQRENDWRNKPGQVESQIVGKIGWRMRAQKSLDEIEEHIGDCSTGIEQAKRSQPRTKPNQTYDYKDKHWRLEKAVK